MLAAPILFRKFGLVTGIICTQIATAVALGCLATVFGAVDRNDHLYGLCGVPMDERAGNTQPLDEPRGSNGTGRSFCTQSLGESICRRRLQRRLREFSFVRFGYPVVLSVLSGVALSAALLFRLLLGKDSLLSPQGSHASQFGD